MKDHYVILESPDGTREQWVFAAPSYLEMRKIVLAHKPAFKLLEVLSEPFKPLTTYQRHRFV